MIILKIPKAKTLNATFKKKLKRKKPLFWSKISFEKEAEEAFLS